MLPCISRFHSVSFLVLLVIEVTILPRVAILDEHQRGHFFLRFFLGLSHTHSICVAIGSKDSLPKEFCLYPCHNKRSSDSGTRCCSSQHKKSILVENLLSFSVSLYFSCLLPNHRHHQNQKSAHQCRHHQFPMCLLRFRKSDRKT